MQSSYSSPVQIRCKFYNDFYALRLSILIRGHPVTLQSTPPQLLQCDALTVKLPVQPLIGKLRHLLAQYGVSFIVSVIPDPRPLLEIKLEEFGSLRKLLSSFDDITPHIWLLVWEGFTTEAKYAGLPLLSVEEGEGMVKNRASDDNNLHLQYMFRPGNSCHLQLFHFSPNSPSKKVMILPVTLANYELTRKAMINSLVFDFQSAMNTHNNTVSSFPLFRGIRQNSIEIILYTFKTESVLLDDLKAELSTVSGWFHIGIVTKMPLSTLMGILFNFRHRGSKNIAKSMLIIKHFFL